MRGGLLMPYLVEQVEDEETTIKTVISPGTRKQFHAPMLQ